MRYCLFLLGLALAGTAWGQGDDPTAGRYFYLQGDYIGDSSLKLLGDNADGDGYGVDLSVPMTPHAFVYAHYDTIAGDNNGDLSTVSGGIGGNITASEGLDLYGIVSYERFDATLGNSAGDLAGYGVRFGARYLEVDQLELGAEVRYVDYGSEQAFGFNDDVGLDGLFVSIGGAYSVSENFALTAEYLTGKYELGLPGGNNDLDRDDLSVGVRWYIAP